MTSEDPRAGEAVSSGGEVFRAVFEQAAIGMGRVRFSDARWIDVNDAFCQMLGYSRDYLLATPWPEITHPDDLELDLVPFRRMAAGELTHYTIEKRFVHRNGEPVWARLTLSLVRDAEGRPAYEIAIIENITDRKRAERELRDERDFISAVLDTAASLVIVLDREGRIVRFNRACELISGHREAEVIGQSYQALIPADERVAVRAALEHIVGGAFPASNENHWEARDGTRRLLAWTNTAIVDRQGRVKFIVSTGVDITERRRAEAAARESQRLLRSTMDNFPTAIAFKDRSGRFLDVNPAVERALGLPKERIKGRRLRDFVSTEAADIADLHDASVMESRRARQYEEAMAVSRHHLNTSFPLIDSEGRVYGTGHISQDITASKLAEAALRDANTRLAEADRRKDEFIAILSHELRNPLAPIRFALPLIEREALSEAGLRALSVIDRQLRHLTRLVDDLLDASRITRGKIELRREQVALDSILTAATEAAAPAILASRHTLKVEVPDEPLWLDADPGRVAQVLTNLLNNSAKFTPRGGQITLAAWRDGPQVVVSVRDTGVGIPAESLPTVFDMFRQGEAPGRAQGGLGIGLALARQLVELHGGTIEARSAGAGQGAEFLVRLPLSAESRETEPTEVRHPPAADGAPLKVLVVDDNVDMVEMLASLVSGLGHDVRKALDGRSAVSAALSYRPDVVLLDLGLPVMSGIDVARELRRHAELAGTRLVALTGWGQVEDRRNTEQAGFDEHLTKPADPRVVERVLAQTSLSKRRR